MHLDLYVHGLGAGVDSRAQDTVEALQDLGARPRERGPERPDIHGKARGPGRRHPRGHVRFVPPLDDRMDRELVDLLCARYGHLTMDLPFVEVVVDREASDAEPRRDRLDRLLDQKRAPVVQEADDIPLFFP